MTTNYIKHWSNILGRNMEYKTYGDSGHAVLVFPSQDGRYYDYQNFDMVATLTPFIEAGQIRLICLDSIDPETWSAAEHNYDWNNYRGLIEKHERWYNYIIEELIPQVRRGQEQFIATGCSMGGFHAGLFFFRRPDLFDTLLSLSGLYHAGYFFHDYSDELVYNNSVIDFLSNMPDDHFYWETYRNSRIIACVGQGKWEDDLLASTRRLDTILAQKNVPHWFDYWGFDSDHDWAWWRKQIYYFMGKVVEDLEYSANQASCYI